jgi:CubicO group peptidase (beta-lactamase class C family)
VEIVLRFWKCAAFLVLWFSAPGFALDRELPQGPGPAAGTNAASIDAFLRSSLATLRIPGLAIGIVDQDRIAHLAGFGVADPSGRPATPATPFIIGSLSKSFTALATMQLVEGGLVDLDAPARRYIPWFTLGDVSSQRITVRQLLNQTSGISVATSEKYAATSDGSEGALEHRVRDLRTAHLDRPVGESFEYSGTNYAILGLLVQTVSGVPYERYVQEHIFGPLQMGHTYTSRSDAATHGLAAGYLDWFGFPRAADLPFNRGSVPQGYIMSTAEDMTHYLIAQSNGGRYGGARVLSAAGISEMQRPAVPTWKPGTSYAMGWEAGPVAGVPAVWHEGSVFNYHANMVMLPGSKSAFVLLENVYSGPDEARLNQIAEGVTLLLSGKAAPAIGSNRGLQLAYVIVVLVAILQVWWLGRAARAALRAAHPRRRRTVLRAAMLILSILVCVSWGVLIVLGIPALFGMPLVATVIRIPDFGYVLLLSAVLAFCTGTLEGVVGIRQLRRWAGVRRSPRPLDAA